MTGDDYRLVTVRVRAVRPQSVFVDKPAARGSGEVPIPRSLIHAADDRKLEGLFAGEEITLRLREWKAEALGFA